MAGTDTNCLPILGIANGVGLGVLQGDEGEQKVTFGFFGQILIFRDDVLQAVFGDGDIVALLLEGHAEDGLRFLFCRNVGRIHLYDEVASLALRLENLQGGFGIGGRDDAVGNLALQEGSCLGVAWVGESDEIAVRRHAVSAARTDVGGRNGRQFDSFDKVCLLQCIGQGNGDGGACRAHMLEGCRCRKAGRFLEFLHELPAVHGVEQIDVAGLSVQYLERKFAAFHINTRGFLVRIAAVFQFEFFHQILSFV